MIKDTFFDINTTLNIGGKLLDISKPKIMGILNVTPDSFFSGNRFQSDKEILLYTEKILSDGADIIDLGAYSSRPGADDVSEEQEKERLIPVIKVITKEFPSAILSVDTFRANIANISIQEGAHIINDISGGELDDEMFETIGRLKVPYILMHMRGNPKNMTKLTDYDNLIVDMSKYFSEKINKLKNLGVVDIVLDPGFGFAKTVEQNYTLLKGMNIFKSFGFPVLAGLSRKTMIWKTLGVKTTEALNGTTVLNVLALQNGASILRVHDVKEAKECVQLLDIYNQA